MIRPARRDEQASIEGVMRRASLHWPAYRADLTAHPEVIAVSAEAIGAGWVRVAERAGRVVGFSAILAPVAGVVELDGLFVEPDAMGTGIGRALVDDALAASGASVMEVTAGPEAKAFYLRVGFVETGSATTQFGPAFRLRRG